MAQYACGQCVQIDIATTAKRRGDGLPPGPLVARRSVRIDPGQDVRQSRVDVTADGDSAKRPGRPIDLTGFGHRHFVADRHIAHGDEEVDVLGAEVDLGTLEFYGGIHGIPQLIGD
ncbi:MAG: hypothetical protein KGS72_05155 [Cyanobacteria bacterium REEB67]|nr:hypothetical protein [Cyanobacteria bacterium REEB67]